MSTYVRSVCGSEYDETAGIPEAGIAPGTGMEDLPDDWESPVCGAAVDALEAQDDAAETPAPAMDSTVADSGGTSGFLSVEFGAVLANLSKGCEKQFREEEAGLFGQLSAYFSARSGVIDGKEPGDLGSMIQQELAAGFPAANRVAADAGDRGAMRALVWSEKVSRMQTSILKRFEKEGNALLEDTSIHVCEICGLVYIGDEPPDICPVCKVPSMKIRKVERR